MPDREPFVDYYKLLEIPPASSDAAIKAAWRAAVKKYRPDLPSNTAASNEHCLAIIKANKTLSDPNRKKEYDRLRIDHYRRSEPAVFKKSRSLVQPPIARFTYVPHELSVTVDASSTSSDPRSKLPLSFIWNWGESHSGTTAPSTLAKATYTYASPGSYTITLQAINSGGLNITHHDVTVRLPPVISNFRLNIDHLYVEVYDIKCIPGAHPKFLFDWGDNSTTDWPAHGYLRPGLNYLTITAITADGESDPARPREVMLYQPAVPGIAGGTPIFRNLPVGPGDLAHLARVAPLGGHAFDVIWRLFESHALKAYAYIAGCHHYASLDDRWQRNYAALDHALSVLSHNEAITLREHFVSMLTGSSAKTRPARRWPGAAEAAWLLLALVSPNDLADSRIQAEAANSPQARSQGWYRRLADQRIDADLEPAQLWLMRSAASLATKQYQEQEEARRRQEEERRRRLRQSGRDLADALAELTDAARGVQRHQEVISYESLDISPILDKTATYIATLSRASRIAVEGRIAVTPEDRAVLKSRLPTIAAGRVQLAEELAAAASCMRQEADEKAAAYRNVPATPRPGPAPSPPSDSAVREFQGYSAITIGALLIGAITFGVGRGSVIGFLLMVFCGAVVLVCMIPLSDCAEGLRKLRSDTQRYLNATAAHREVVASYRQNEKHRAELAAAAEASHALAARVAPDLDSLGKLLLRIARLTSASFVEQVLADLA